MMKQRWLFVASVVAAVILSTPATSFSSRWSRQFAKQLLASSTWDLEFHQYKGEQSGRLGNGGNWGFFGTPIPATMTFDERMRWTMTLDGGAGWEGYGTYSGRLRQYRVFRGSGTLRMDRESRRAFSEHARAWINENLIRYDETPVRRIRTSVFFHRPSTTTRPYLFFHFKAEGRRRRDKASLMMFLGLRGSRLPR